MGELSALHIGAVGLGSMIFNFIYWNLGFLRMGTTGMTAQAYGKKDTEALVHTLCRALLVALMMSGFMLLLQHNLAKLSFHLMNVSEAQNGLIADYFYIRMLAAPATLTLIALMGWFFGMQNALYPLVLTLVINGTNIACSYVLVVYYQWGIEGVAWGTVCAQYAGLICGLCLLHFKYRKLWLHFSKKALFKAQAFLSFLTINRDIFLRTFCLTVAFAFFYSQSAAEGALILAVNTILMHFLNWMSFGVDGFAYAAESMVGKYKGANHLKACKQSVRISMLMGMGLALVYSVTYAIAGPSIVHIFTEDPLIFDSTMPYLWWMVLLPIAGSPCYIWDGVFVGLTAVKAMRNSMAIALIIYLACYYGLRLVWPQTQYLTDCLWASLICFLAARGGIMSIYYQKKGIAL